MRHRTKKKSCWGQKGLLGAVKGQSILTIKEQYIPGVGLVSIIFFFFYNRKKKQVIPSQRFLVLEKWIFSVVWKNIVSVCFSFFSSHYSFPPLMEQFNCAFVTWQKPWNFFNEPFASSRRGAFKFFFCNFIFKSECLCFEDKIYLF